MVSLTLIACCVFTATLRSGLYGRFTIFQIFPVPFLGNETRYLFICFRLSRPSQIRLINEMYRQTVRLVFVISWYIQNCATATHASSKLRVNVVQRYHLRYKLACDGWNPSVNRYTSILLRLTPSAGMTALRVSRLSWSLKQIGPPLIHCCRTGINGRASVQIEFNITLDTDIFRDDCTFRHKAKGVHRR